MGTPIIQAIGHYYVKKKVQDMLGYNHTIFPKELLNILFPHLWISIKISHQLFINDPDGIKDQGQEGTCYAQAAVTCIRCAEVRLKLQYPSRAMQIYLQKIINKFGKSGGQVKKVLKWILQQLNLHLQFKQIESNKNTFDEAAKQKIEMIKMYLKKLIPVLIVVCWTQQPLKKDKNTVNLKTSCHAMVIVGMDGDYWKVQNSWGKSAHQEGIVKMHHQSYIREAYIIYGKNEQI